MIDYRYRRDIRDLKKLDVTILNTYIHASNAKLIKFEHDEDKYHLYGTTIKYRVKIVDREFLIAFQNDRLADCIEQEQEIKYTKATFFGYDKDESGDLADFFKDKDEKEKGEEILQILEYMAEDEGWKIHKELKK